MRMRPGVPSKVARAAWRKTARAEGGAVTGSAVAVTGWPGAVSVMCSSGLLLGDEPYRVARQDHRRRARGAARRSDRVRRAAATPDERLRPRRAETRNQGALLWHQWYPQLLYDTHQTAAVDEQPAALVEMPDAFN